MAEVISFNASENVENSKMNCVRNDLDSQGSLGGGRRG